MKDTLGWLHGSAQIVTLLLVAVALLGASCASDTSERVEAALAQAETDLAEARSTAASAAEVTEAQVNDLESVISQQKSSIEDLTSEVDELSGDLAAERARSATLADEASEAQGAADVARTEADAAKAVLELFQAEPPDAEIAEEPTPEPESVQRPALPTAPAPTPPPPPTPSPTALPTATPAALSGANPCPDFSFDDVGADPTGDWDGDRLENSYEFYNSDQPCAYRSLTCADLERLLDEGKEFVIQRGNRDETTPDSDTCLFALRT